MQFAGVHVFTHSYIKIQHCIEHFCCKNTSIK